MTLRTYAHVIDEFRGAGAVDPDELIAEARAAVKRGEVVADGPQMDPKTRTGRHQGRPRRSEKSRKRSEALCRTRTGDPFLTMEVLYQLS